MEPPPLPATRGVSYAPAFSPGTVNPHGLLTSIERASSRAFLALLVLALLEVLMPPGLRPTSIAGGAFGNLAAADIEAKMAAEAEYKRIMAEVDLMVSQREKLLQIEQSERERRLQLQQEEMHYRRNTVYDSLAGQRLAANLFDVGCAIGVAIQDFRFAGATCGKGDGLRRNMQIQLNQVTTSGNSPFRD